MRAPDRRHAASSVAQIALLFGLPASLPGDAWVTSFDAGFGAFDPTRRSVDFRDFGFAFGGFFRRRVLVAFRLRLLVHLFFGRFRRFALGPPFLHLLHRLAVVVKAGGPRTGA